MAMSLSRFASFTLAFALVLALDAGCGGTRSCNSGTVMLTVKFDSKTRAATSMDVETTIGTDGGAPHSESVSRTAGSPDGTLEVAFPGGYPTGARLTVKLTARNGTGTLGVGTGTIPALPAGCATLSIVVGAPDGSSGAAGVGGTGGTGGADAGGGSAGDAASAADGGTDPDAAFDVAPDAVTCPAATACTAGTTKCNGTALVRCQLTNGCWSWAADETCSGFQTCQGAAPTAACACPARPTGCENGVGTSCRDSKTVEACVADANGCIAKQAMTTTCAGVQTCTGTHPTAKCSCPAAPAMCTSGQGAFCESATSVATCGADAQGCVSISGRVTCDVTKPCSGTYPSASCSSCPAKPPECSAGVGTSCQGNSVVTCALDGNGCLYVKSTTTCPTGKPCAGTAPNAACTCPVAPTGCNGVPGNFCETTTSSATCAINATNGCLEITARTTCPADANPCTDAACSGGTCGQANDDTNTCTSGTCHVGSCCTGCWNGTSCQGGGATTACGAAGASCVTCPDDGNACTDATCTAGTCSHKNDDTNSCTGGVCQSGVCQTCSGNNVCVDQAPSGWLGPIALYEGVPSATPSCSAPFSSEVFTLRKDPVQVPATCSTCSCSYNATSYPTGWWCEATWKNKATGTCPISTGNGGTFGVSAAGPSVHVEGACNDLGSSFPIHQFTNVRYAGEGAACKAGAAQSPTVPAATWSAGARGCALPFPNGNGCSAGNVCAPIPTAPFNGKLCVYQPGDVACPTVRYVTKKLYYANSTDTRTCSTCGCTASGLTCNINIKGYSNAACTTETFSTDAALSTPSACVAASARYYKYTVSKSASCSAIGGAPTGTITPTEPTTICCTI